MDQDVNKKLLGCALTRPSHFLARVKI